MGEIRIINLVGTPQERGYHHGQVLRDKIHHLYQRFIEMMEGPPLGQKGSAAQFSERDLLAFALAHAPATKDYAPDLYAEIEGIAGGAGMSCGQVILLNCVAEVRRLMFTGSAARAVSRALATPPQPGCTCLAVQGRATADQQVYIGQGYDIEPLWEPVVFRTQDREAGLEQVVMGHPGILAQFGLNGAGLAFVGSGLLVSDQRPGVPAPVVARKILQQARLSDALEVIVGAERTIGISYVVASSFGVVDLETSAAAYNCHYLQEGVFACANHIRSSALAHVYAGLYGLDSLVREGRMLQLLRAGHGALGVESLQTIQADHADFPVSICRHIVEGTSEAMTRCAAIIKPAERTMWIAGGNPCERPYVEIQIQ